MHVPITHDETGSIIPYQEYSTWEVMMYPYNSPNNHILNSLFTKYSVALFGMEQWAVRLPNLLSFILFAWGVVRVLYLFFKKESVLLIAGLSLFVANAYFLDFFGLCRGYGMAAALATLAASFLLSAWIKDKESHIWTAFVLSILASYANFTLLLFWIAISILCGIYFLQKEWKKSKKLFSKLGIMLLMSLSYFALILTPLKKMSSNDEFRHWSSNGFFDDTIMTLVVNWKYSSTLLFHTKINDAALIFSSLLFVGLLLVFFRFFKNGFTWGNYKNPIALSLSILGLTILVNFLQTWIMGTPNLTNRTALFFYPLFSIFLLSLLSEFEKLKIKKANLFLAIIIPFFAFWHLQNTFSPEKVREWWFDQDTTEVLDYLEAEAIKEQRKISLRTEWKYTPSFWFYKQTGKTPINVHKFDKELKTELPVDYYYVFWNKRESLEEDYEKVKKFKGGGILMKKN